MPRQWEPPFCAAPNIRLRGRALMKGSLRGKTISHDGELRLGASQGRSPKLLFLACIVFAAVSLPAIALADQPNAEAPLAADHNANYPITDPEAAEELPHSELDRSGVVELLEGVFEPILQGAAGPFDDLSPEWFIGDHAAVIASDESPEPAVQIGSEETGSPPGSR